MTGQNFENLNIYHCIYFSCHESSLKLTSRFSTHSFIKELNQRMRRICILGTSDLVSQTTVAAAFPNTTSPVREEALLSWFKISGEEAEPQNL
jgi:hypothetical protein